MQDRRRRFGEAGLGICFPEILSEGLFLGGGGAYRAAPRRAIL